ncbi:MAG: cytochrome b/b6 domain-containing protein [Zavarzinia sp.]|nr:cytochrome b/b6 domain-containing protein [Zavarzinia sp.]
MTAADRPASAPAVAPTPGVRVWDPFVRLFHWSVVAGVVLNYAVLEEGKPAHRYIGYGVAALLGLRLVWGFVGSRHARFADFVAGPRTVFGHLRAALSGRDRRYIGHNPAGGAMILVLMALIGLIAVSGWMQGLDAFWGEEWVQDLHAIAANVLVGFAVLHVAAALIEGLRHRESLVLAMITGRKRPASGTDVDHAPAPRRG